MLGKDAKVHGNGEKTLEKGLGVIGRYHLGCRVAITLLRSCLLIYVFASVGSAINCFVKRV